VVLGKNSTIDNLFLLHSLFEIMKIKNKKNIRRF